MDAGGALVGTSTTTADGNYLFGGVNDTNMSSGSVLRGNNYEVRIVTTQGGNLTGLGLTVRNSDGITNNDALTDLRDSDAVWSGVNAVIVYTTGRAGENNHALDFGFVSLDYGDLPDVYGTTNAQNGARHALDNVHYLGACVDSETNGQPISTADGDDLTTSTFRTDGTCTSGDEDGVTIPVLNDPIWSGTTAVLPVSVSANACLNIWIDYGNGGTGNSLPDGDFADSGEHVLINHVVTAATTSVTVGVPAWAFDADYTGNRNPYLRARLTPRDANAACGGAEAYGGTASPTGAAKGGEVEDYQMEFSPTAVSLSSINGNTLSANSQSITKLLMVLTILLVFVRRRQTSTR